MTHRPSISSRGVVLALLAGAVCLAGLGFAASASAAELQADFHFKDTRTAPTGQTITDIGDGNAFAAEFVDGAASSRQVLAFPEGNGLSLPTAGLAASGSYSVVLLFRLDSATPGRRKLLDFSAGSSDAGLYLCDGRLLIELLVATPCPLGPAFAGDWAQVTITRDHLTNEVHAYLGDDQPSVEDLGAGLTPGSELRFFRDDDVLPADEHSGGAVARIRIYDGVLSAAEVAALDRVDTTAPAIGLNAVPATTNDPAPTFSGGAGSTAGDLAGVTLRIYAGSTASGTPVDSVTVTRSAGGWSAAAPTPLADGTYTARAEQADGAGNLGLSETRTFTVDTVGAAVSLDAPTNGTATNDSTPTYSGDAGDAPGDSETVTVRVYGGSAAAGLVVQTLQATRAGESWSVDGSPSLSDGTYTAQAEQLDAAGNVAVSEASTFTVDTAAPGLSLDTPAIGPTSDTTPTYSGSAGDAPGDADTVAVNVYAGAAASGAPVQTLAATRSGGSWSVEGTQPLADGTYTARAEQLDAAGNRALSEPRTFTVDTVGAGVSLDRPATGIATNDSTPTYSGAAGSGADDSATVTVRVYSGGTASGAVLQTLTATRSGGSWTVDGSSPLGEGTYTAQAAQSDLAGNLDLSDPVTFTIDLTRPDTSLTSGPPAVTNDATPEFAFSSEGADRFVCRLYGSSDTGPPGFAACSSPRAGEPLADGSYVFEVAAVDAAGNQDDSPDTRAFRIDTVAPRTTIVAGPADTTAVDTAFVFAASEAASFSCRLDDGPWQPCGSPQSYSGLALGPHQFEVRAADDAGNQEPAPARHAWQVLKPGIRIPATGAQAVALAQEIAELRSAFRRLPLRRLARRRTITLRGFDALTAGIVDFRARALLRRRPRGRIRHVTVATARYELPTAARYSLPAQVTTRGRRLARRRAKLRVELVLTFTDLAGRSLRAAIKTTMVR